MEFIRKANSLPGMFYVITPDPCVPETVDKVAVKFPADILNRAAGPDYQGFFEVGLFTLRTEEEPHEPESLVDLLF